MTTGDRIRIALSPMYLVVGASVLLRAPREPLAWLLGLSFIAYGVYRLALVRRALKR